MLVQKMTYCGVRSKAGELNPTHTCRAGALKLTVWRNAGRVRFRA